MISVNQTTGEFSVPENNSVDSENTEHQEWSKSVSEGQLGSLSPLLPRSAWQNQQAFLRVLIKAKQALDMAEITATLWG